jgi:hypothetical protein
MSDRQFFVSCSAVNPDGSDFTGTVWQISEEVYQMLSAELAERLDSPGASVITEDVLTVKDTDAIRNAIVMQED